MFFVTEQQVKTIHLQDDAYPSALRTLSDAPKTLYAVGDLSLLKSDCLTVVGSRRTPVYALKVGKQIVEELSQVYTIVTGTADGGDGAAIEGALLGSGRVICVLAGGFSALPQNALALLEKVAKTGLLLSPYPFETAVRSFSYEYRNKLLATLGVGTFVLGAAEKSGALITAKYAKQCKKPVFALPYAVGAAAGAGCNALIKAGGFLTETAKDIFDRFGVERAEKKECVSLSAEENAVYTALRDAGELHLSELSAKAGVPAYKARALLSALEVKGLAVGLGGNRYAPLG